MPRVINPEVYEQENAQTRGVKLMVAPPKPAAKKALGDLGNTIHQLPDSTLVAKNTKTLGIHKVSKPTSKVANGLDKENTLKVPNKEPQRLNRIAGRKPIRQESIVTSAKLQLKKAEEILQLKKAEGIYDPDEQSRDDPSMVTEYVQDILRHLRQLEVDYPINEKFLEDTKVTPKMRSTLVNWLVDAHKNFNLSPETLYLCVSLVDRYMQLNKEVDLTIYQLVGTAGLLLASKYEEIYPPDFDDFVYICDNAFTKRELRRMEIDMVTRLDFRLGWPVAIYFLRRYSKIGAAKIDHHNLGKYILELALLEYRVAHVRPSHQAAAACCLAIAVVNEIMDPAKVWTATFVHYTKLKYVDFKDTLYAYASLIAKAETSKYDSVRRKYAESKFGKISLSNKLKGPLLRKLTLSPCLGKK